MITFYESIRAGAIIGGICASHDGAHAGTESVPQNTIHENMFYVLCFSRGLIFNHGNLPSETAAETYSPHKLVSCHACLFYGRLSAWEMISGSSSTLHSGGSVLGERLKVLEERLNVWLYCSSSLTFSIARTANPFHLTMSRMRSSSFTFS